MMSTLRRAPAAMLCALTGYAAGEAAGTRMLGSVLRASGRSYGWEDLVASAAAMVTFGPLGALAALAAWLRPAVAGRRAVALAALAAAVPVASAAVWAAVGLFEALAAAAWGWSAALVVWMALGVSGRGQG